MVLWYFINQLNNKIFEVSKLLQILTIKGRCQKHPEGGVPNWRPRCVPPPLPPGSEKIEIREIQDLGQFKVCQTKQYQNNETILPVFLAKLGQKLSLAQANQTNVYSITKVQALDKYLNVRQKNIAIQIILVKSKTEQKHQGWHR